MASFVQLKVKEGEVAAAEEQQSFPYIVECLASFEALCLIGGKVALG